MTLNERIFGLERAIQCKIIFLNGYFTRLSIDNLKEVFLYNQKSCFDNILLILRSKGGDNVYGENFLSIRELIAESLHNKKLWVLINKEVASTGTVFSFSGDKLLYLNPDCKIGPIDPQIIENNESLINKETEIQIDWESNKIIKTNISNSKGIKTLEASIRSLSIGKIINKRNLDQAFRYLLNLNNDFNGHSDRRTIRELPKILSESLHDIKDLINPILISEIINDLEYLSHDSNYFIYGL